MTTTPDPRSMPIVPPNPPQEEASAPRLPGRGLDVVVFTLIVAATTTLVVFGDAGAVMLAAAGSLIAVAFRAWQRNHP